jgi:hypothetical protein
MPLLRREGDLPIYVRLYDDPVGDIKKAAADSAGSVDWKPETPLPQFLSSVARTAGRPVVFFVDQFEEIFVRQDRESRDRFAAAIEGALAQARGQVRFVFSFREDFLARLAEFRERIPTIFHNEIRLSRLSNDACRAAIIEPAKLFGLEVEPALSDRLLADLSDEGVDPPQLQIVCDALYDSLPPGETRMTLDSYRTLGGTRQILADYLERVLRELSPRERETTREVLKHLVTAENTKTVSRLTDLARLVARSEDELSRVLAELLNRRLVREVQREEGSWYELTHEYLVQEIARWLSEQEKELKRVRELLEQAIRNRRNLGILMPAPQIQLIQQHEDDLALSREEHQLVRDSEDALRTKRRTLATAGMAAALILLVTGAAGRYVYLSTHRFIQPRDNELVEVQGGKKTGHRFEEIRAYAGSPAPFWLDPELGFPRFQYETDFELNQLDPARRAALKAGLLFDRGANPDDEILGMLQPIERARFLITFGRTDEAVKLLLALYRDPSVDKNSLDRLTTLAGYTAISDMQVAQSAAVQAFRPTSNNPFNQPTDNLGALLANLPQGGWRAVVVPLIANPANRRGAIDLVSLLGLPADAALVRPFLEDVVGSEQLGREVRSVAIRALGSLADCSAIDQIRRIAVDPAADTNTTSASSTYISRCGSRLDLKTLEAAGRKLDIRGGGGPFAELALGSTIRTLYEMFGASAVPVIRGLLTGWPLTRFKLDAIRDVPEPEFLPDLHGALTAPLASVRALAAATLAARGDLEGVPTAAQVAQDTSQSSEFRADALRALKFVKGSSARTILSNLAKADTEPDVRSAAIRGLRWYDDDDTLAVLFKAFEDSDRTVREAALETFTFLPAERTANWIGNKQRGLSRGQQVYATRVLQRSRRSEYADTYRGLLAKADASIDYPALTQAIIGLRDAWVTEPVAAVIDGLADPKREIRLAATLALVDHPDRATVVPLLRSAETKTRATAAVRRAEWAVGVALRADQLRDQARSALASGDLARADQVLRLMTGPRSGYQAALKYGLSSPRTTAVQQGFIGDTSNWHLFDEVFASSVNTVALLHAELDIRRGSLSTALRSLTTYAAQHPNARKELREDSRFAPLRSDYEFRLVTGLQQPLTVGEGFKP